MSNEATAAHKLEVVHPDPSQAHKMPYAPAIRMCCCNACCLCFARECLKRR